MNKIEEVKELKAKRNKAQTELTKAQTQLESLVERKEELERELMQKFGVTVAEAQTKMAELEKERDELLNHAKKHLEGIQL